MNALQDRSHAYGGHAEVRGKRGSVDRGRNETDVCDDSDEANAGDPGGCNCNGGGGRAEAAEKVGAAQPNKKTAVMIKFLKFLWRGTFTYL